MGNLWATLNAKIRYNCSMAKTKEIDLDKVEELASFGLSEQQIADSLGISRSTLSRRKKDNETFDIALRMRVGFESYSIRLGKKRTTMR